jgi:hypothetical protein
MPFTLPADVAGRPIAIEGAGTLGRRIASVYVAGGTDVRLHDASPKQLEGAIQHVTDNAVGVRRTLDLHPANGLGSCTAFGELADAVRGAWMVVESVPEDLELKRQVFGQLDELADSDAILASKGLKRRRRLPRRRYRAAAVPGCDRPGSHDAVDGRFRGVGSSTPRWANHGCPCHGPLSDPEGVRRGAMLPTGRQAVLPQNLPSSGPPAL